MAHLSGFGLENFRVFKEYTWFDFAPITILVGPNNSGKSSLIKALLLLKDNLDKNNLPPYYDVVAEDLNVVEDEDFNETESFFWQALEPSTLVFDGKVHGLNTVMSALNNEADPKELKFKIVYPVVSGEKERMNVSKTLEGLRAQKEERRGKELPDYDQIKSLMYEVKGAGRNLVRPDRMAYDQLIKYSISYRVDDSGNVETTHELELLNEKDECFLRITDYEIFFDPILYDAVFIGIKSNVCGLISNFYSKTLKEAYQPSLSEWFLNNGINDKEGAKELSELIYKQLGLVKKKWSYAPKAVCDLLGYIQYIATSKYEQERVYLDTKESLSQKLLKELLNVQKRGFNVEKFLEISTKVFGIEGKMRVDYDSEKGIIFPNINGKSLLNFGYGYTQIAFLLFKILAIINSRYYEPNMGKVDHQGSSLLLLEEPETNLHPRLQSQLADLIQQYVKNFDMQFIIETHSEYMIRKLQYLTAKGEIKPEDVIIYYFNDPNNIPAGEKQVKKINILEDGSLSDDFGSGFYDEAATWELELLKLKKSKGRQN